MPLSFFHRIEPSLSHWKNLQPLYAFSLKSSKDFIIFSIIFKPLETWVGVHLSSKYLEKGLQVFSPVTSPDVSWITNASMMTPSARLEKAYYKQMLWNRRLTHMYGWTGGLEIRFKLMVDQKLN